jgi:hypothetical protein
MKWLAFAPNCGISLKSERIACQTGDFLQQKMPTDPIIFFINGFVGLS